MTENQIQETITIKGHLGPIRAIDSPLSLDISPLTVFIGPQGTGKSLISQLLYFFRDAQYLISTHSKQDDPDKSVRKIIESIRSGESSKRAFASFVMDKQVDIKYTQKRLNQVQSDWEISCYETNRQIVPKNQFKKEIESWLLDITNNPLLSENISSKALFIPAERSFFSRLINTNPQALGSSDLPLTMREFANVLIKAANTHQKWQEEETEKPLEVTEIDDIITNELGGYAVFSRRGPYARSWQWKPIQGNRAIEIEMASSGQMETWPMVSIAQAMFEWKLEKRPLFIHIEEPETHLHPMAQVAITKLLAYLCNKGFRLVITTHSVFVLYVLNNLILAQQNLPQTEFKDLPLTSQRLKSNQLSAYLFADGTAVSIRDSESGQLDESQLSRVMGDLEVQYNQIQSYNILWS
jgi:hypothetical protein